MSKIKKTSTKKAAAVKPVKLKTAKQLDIEKNPVNITHTIQVGGLNLTKGDKFHVQKLYYRNGETQALGYLNGSEKLQEIPEVWTDLKYSDDDNPIMKIDLSKL